MVAIYYIALATPVARILNAKYADIFIHRARLKHAAAFVPLLIGAYRVCNNHSMLKRGASEFLPPLFNDELIVFQVFWPMKRHNARFCFVITFPVTYIGPFNLGFRCDQEWQRCK